MHENDRPTNHHSGNDVQLSRAVMAAVSRFEPIRASDLDTIQIEASDGKVVLTGLVGSESHKYVAGQLASTVPGVGAVQNLLVTREDVERGIAASFASHEETRHLRLAVRVEGRVATLFGAVGRKADEEFALQVAQGAAQGLEVRSALRIVPAGQPVILLEQWSLEGRQMAGLGLKRLESADASEESAADTPPAASPSGAPIGELA